jgi:two-component system nitrogen regulation sensor histidine kinase NtrY
MAGIVQYAKGSELLTLAVKATRGHAGDVITFEDITRQLIDQRQAAWSDVARRIAHEIKNPLTPIQLATERLKRRYTKLITADTELFEELTGTIIRQVGDLRRMVDEFSSFARLPKPVFRARIRSTSPGRRCSCRKWRARTSTLPSMPRVTSAPSPATATSSVRP